MTETATPLLPLVLSLALAGGAALAAELTECGQAVRAGEIGSFVRISSVPRLPIRSTCPRAASSSAVQRRST